MKTTKGGKVMNPTDAYRKELRKKELKRNKKERKKVREVGILKKDPETIKEQIEKLELMKADGALDKARKHKKRQLEDTLNLVMKKRKEYEDKMREKGETPVMFSHLAPPKRWTAAEEDERAKHPKPEDSVYYHPTLNPTGAPPPGKPPMYKSSIGPRIPLGTSSSNAASSSISEPDEVNLAFPPPPPPLATSSNLSSVEDSDVPKFIPLPPALPVSPKLDSESSTSFLRPPLPPLPQKEPTRIQSSLLPPPPPGTSQSERESKQNMTSDGQSLKDVDHAGVRLPPPPPPPPSLPPKQADQLSDIEKSEYNSSNTLGTSDISKIPLLPPPSRHPPPPPPRFPLIPSSQADVFPPGISRIPPPPADTRPTLSIPGISSRPPPHGMLAPPMPMANFAVPQVMPLMGGLATMMMPSLLPNPSLQEDGNAAGVGFPVPHKPSYVKSAESTVVKRPLAQHTPELTAMVPASVRVRREAAAPPKAKPKSQLPVSTSSSKPLIPPTGVRRSEEPWTASSSVSKRQSIDDSYTAFLEDMKALGALDG